MDRKEWLRAKLEAGLAELERIHADVDRWEVELEGLESPPPSTIGESILET